MRSNGYHSDELKSFHRVLDSAISEAKSYCLDLPVTEMTERLFSAADNGERDPIKLKAAVLTGIATASTGTNAHPQPGPLPITITNATPSRRSAAGPIKGKSPSHM